MRTQNPSKCDQFGKGVAIVLGRTGHSLCSVNDISVCGSGFQLPQARVLMKAWIVGQLRFVLVSLGLFKELYTGHTVASELGGYYCSNGWCGTCHKPQSRHLGDGRVQPIFST